MPATRSKKKKPVDESGSGSSAFSLPKQKHGEGKGRGGKLTGKAKEKREAEKESVAATINNPKQSIPSDDPSISEPTSDSNSTSNRASEAVSNKRSILPDKATNLTDRQSSTHRFTPPPSSSPQGISLYLANAKKSREFFSRQSSSSPNPLLSHLQRNSPPDQDFSLSIRPDSPQPQPRLEDGDDDDDSSMIEYVDESLVVSGKNRPGRVGDDDDKEEQEQEDEIEEDKENHPSQLSAVRPATPNARLAKSDQPNHSTPIPPQHSTPIGGAPRAQRPAGPRSVLRPLELEGASLDSATHSKPKSLLDEALDLSSQSGGEGSEIRKGRNQGPPSSQRHRPTITEIRTAAHAREQAQLNADQQDGSNYLGTGGMEADDMYEMDEDEEEEENQEDPFGFFVSLKTRKRKSEDPEVGMGRDGKKSHRSIVSDLAENGRVPKSDLALDENVELERESSKTSNATQVKSAQTSTSIPTTIERQQEKIPTPSDSSSPESLSRVKDLLPKEKATKHRQTTPSPTRSLSPSTSELAKGHSADSQTPSQRSGQDQFPSSPDFDVVLPRRDRKLRPAAASTSTKADGKTTAAKTRGKAKEKGKAKAKAITKGKQAGKEQGGDQSRLKIEDLVRLLPSRRGRVQDSLSPPPGSRETGTKSRPKSNAKPASKNSASASKSKKSSKKQESSDEDDDIFSSSDKGKDEEIDESWIRAAGKRIPLKPKNVSRSTPKENNNPIKKSTSTSSKSTAKKTSSTLNPGPKKPTASSKKGPHQGSKPKSSRKGSKGEMRVLVIIDKSDAETDSGTDDGISQDDDDDDDDDDTSKENVGTSKKKPSSKVVRKRKPGKTSKSIDSGSDTEQEPSSDPAIKEARNKRLKSYHALDDYQLAEEKVL